MANKNYVRGRTKEYKIRNALIKAGYDIVQRTAGSHSPIDVIAIHKKKRKILLIQAKPDNYSPKKTIQIYKENVGLSGNYYVQFEVY